MIQQMKPWLILVVLVVAVLGVVGVVANITGLFIAAGFVALVATAVLLFGRRKGM